MADALITTPEISGASSKGDWAVLGGLTALTLLLHAIFYKGYGFFRDELYFIACSRHLAWGYVDHPPGVPLIAWASQHILGDTLFAIRFVPILFAGAQLLVTGLTARALGGGRYAQLLAGICVLAAPQYFGSYLNTDMFMVLGWAACAWVAARVFSGETERLWLLFGIFAGLSLQGKHAMLFFCLAFVAGLLISPQRKMLLSPWLWAGGAVAFLIAMPNVIWEHTHQWATYELLSNIAKSDKNLVLSPWQYLKSNIDAIGRYSLPIWMAGLLWCLFAERGRRFRALGWSWLAGGIIFIVLKGKDYYFTPMYPMLFAAGAVAVEVWLAPRGAWLRVTLQSAIAAAVLVGIIGWPFSMPMMPPEKFIAYEHRLGVAPKRTETKEVSELPQQYADMFGWPEAAAAVAAVYDSLSEEQRASCAILTQNYGEAAALDYFGRQYGLPHAISGHQSYWLWGPGPFTGECMITVGLPKERLDTWYTSVVKRGEIYHPYAMPFENHRSIRVCTGKKFGTLQEIWPQMKLWR